MRLTGGVIDHLLCVTVVCTDEQNAVYILHCLYCLAYALIYGLNSLDGCGDHTGMAYHIGVREVDHDHIVFFRTDRVKQLLTYCGSTHLGLQIVGSYILGRIYQDTILSLVGLLYAAVEEEVASKETEVTLTVEETDVKLSEIKDGVKEIISIELLEDNGKNKVYTLKYNGTEDIRKVLFKKCVEKDITIIEMKKKEVSLEEAFLKITEEGENK